MHQSIVEEIERIFGTHKTSFFKEIHLFPRLLWTVKIVFIYYIVILSNFCLKGRELSRFFSVQRKTQHIVVGF